MPRVVRLYFLLLGLCVGLSYLRLMPTQPLTRLGIVVAATLVFSGLVEVYYRRNEQPTRIRPIDWLCVALLSLSPLDTAAIWLGVPENWAVGAMAAVMAALIVAMVVAFRRMRQQTIGPLSSAKLRLVALLGVLLIVGVTIGVAASLRS